MPPVGRRRGRGRAWLSAALLVWAGCSGGAEDGGAATDDAGDSRQAEGSRGVDGGADAAGDTGADGADSGAGGSDAPGPDGGSDTGAVDGGIDAGEGAAPDCDGVPGGSAREDRCGTCDDDPGNDCVQDCAGTWGGSAQEDRCGICDRNPDNDCTQDCAGVWGGNARRDMCGVCNASPSDDCVQDCAGTWGGNATTDMCGVCNANPSDDCVQDCAGTWGGNATADMCGVCNANPSDDCVQDCAGTWGGSAQLDCAGACGGSATMDDCGTCDDDAGNDCDCLGVPGGAAVEDACGTCDDDPDNDCDEDFILDVVTHVATPETNPLGAIGLSTFVGQLNARFPWIVRSPGVTGSGQFDRTEYIAQVLMGSDTDVGVLTGIAYTVGADGTGVSGFAAISNEDLLGAYNYLDGLYPGRTLLSCMVMPNDRIDVQLANMERLAPDCPVWHTNPGWGPGSGSLPSGYWLDQDVGPMMIQQGLDLGRPIFLVWKGMPLNSFSPTYTDPGDVGPAARMFPDATFVILHSAFEHGLASGENSDPGGVYSGDSCDGSQRPFGSWPEGPYDEVDTAVQMDYPLDRGVNSLIKSLRDNNIGPNGKDLDDPTGPVTTRVYASLDAVWAHLMTGRNEEAMHVLGKLLLHVGEDRILWGTESLWYGSPQPQIDAFRCFEISEAFQTTYGYPALTPAIKAKILGLNAAAMLSQLPDVSLP